MCAILHLKPGVMPTINQLEYACYNNWHSYGLVTKVGNKLDIKRVLPESGEVDPKEVWDALTADIEYERFLHLRHNTAGATTIENTHPFEVFFSKKRHILWMHNGTLHPYKSKKQMPSGGQIDDPDGPSDSANFATQVLQPYLAGCNFGNGTGDIHHPLFKRIIKDHWTGSNRGLLIANDQEPLFIDEWKTITGKDGKTFYASNDEYFEKLVRGPEKDRREAAAKAKALEESNKNRREVQQYLNDGNNSRTIIPLASVKPNTISHSFYKLSESLSSLVNDWDVYDRDGAVSLGYATKEELSEFYDGSKLECVALMEWVFTDYLKMYEELISLREDKDSATRKIASLVTELKQLKKGK